MSVQEKPKSSFLKNCLIVGCVMSVVAALCVVGLSYWFFKKVGVSLTDDPVQVEAIATKILPGAKPPAGFKAQWGGDLFGFQGAFFGPSHGGDAQPGEAEFIMMRLPESKELNIDQLRKDFKNQSGREDTADQKVLSEEKITLKVGGKPVQASHCVVEEKGQKENQIVTIFLDKEKHLVIVMASGPQEKFPDAAVQTFFDGLNISNLEAIDPETVEAEAPPETRTEPSPTEEGE